MHRCAFPQGEGEIVAKLAIDLLGAHTTPQTFSFVAETDGALVGHIAFSPVLLAADEDFLGYILAPLAVQPEHQHCQVGSQLIAHGLRQLSTMEVHIVCVYGDPQYYGRFGFSAAAARPYRPPYPLHHPFGWQAIVLTAHDRTNPPAALTCAAALCDPKLW